MTDIVIRAEHLGKKYIIRHEGQERYKTLRDVLAKGARRWGRRVLYPLRPANGTAASREEFWALKDVSFEVKRGERLGIIGRNGAGKSTLLKILSRITEPTAGRVTIRGRVSSLLEVGTGFHPELTGRENIYLNGAILGMSRDEIKRKFDDIVAFAEVEKFLDTPVKRYSSGMYVRLAFAVAAHLEPEILLVDEVLAVGDAAFQKRCLGKMETVAKQGRTVLFVSHNMAAISALCTRAILLDMGKVALDSVPEKGIAKYIDSFASKSEQSLMARNDRQGTGEIQVVSLRVENAEKGSLSGVRTGDEVCIVLEYESRLKERLRDIVFSVTVNSRLGSPLITCRNDYTGDHFEELPSRGEVKCVIPRFPLVPGSYHLNTYVERKGEILDWVRSAAVLRVFEGDFYGTGRQQPSSHAPFLVKHRWLMG